jgi:peptidoglycan L-alanyl-D-glutamate endopeptidase CwlK
MTPEERSYAVFDGLNPDFKQKVVRWYEECKNEGLQILVYCGFRSDKEQDALYRKGRTAGGQVVTNARAGQSFHNYGRAIDYVPVKNGEASWDDAATYLKAQRIAKEFGLRPISWELPHLEDDSFKNWRELKAMANPKKLLFTPIVEQLKGIVGRSVGGRGLQ